MKRSFSIAAILALATLFSGPARPQTTTSTELILTAHWDDETAVAGSVHLAMLGPSGTQAVIATQKLSSTGWSAIATNLAANSVYAVTLTNPAGAQIVSFPLATAMINPSNLQRGEVDLVFRKANGTMKSAKIVVSMGF